jgi:hypothetical protein
MKTDTSGAKRVSTDSKICQRELRDARQENSRQHGARAALYAQVGMALTLPVHNDGRP